MTIKDFILSFNELFKGNPWYGVSTMDSLETISFEQWNKKPIGVSNSIATIVWHVIDWRCFVIEKIKDNEAFDIVLNTEADWRKDILVNKEADVLEIVTTLKNTQETICRLLKEKPASWLLETTKGKEYNNEYMLRGILNHDAYHLGQINLIYSQLNKSDIA